VEIARQIFSVLLVFALLGVGLWALRKGSFRLSLARPSRGRTRSLETLERLALTPQHSLHLVRIGGRELLVATHPQGCTLLTRFAEKTSGAGA